MSIRENIERIQARIAAACARAGRNPAEVRLVAVSKTKPAALIGQAAAAGQRLFGENYVQEFADKAEEVRAPVEWHFIGALQSNKVKYLRGKVAMIHSLDRLSLAEEINRQWAKLDRPVDVLLEVNLGDETSKAGTGEDQAIDLVR
ncbi:MAG: YggS family pyridoxal phosphate-dependent enzyme, partial [Trichloromonas sp.]|nr:YggS family pyridoxal phosphate-dependent enzyme [Trichloromonas sp.]